MQRKSASKIRCSTALFLSVFIQLCVFPPSLIAAENHIGVPITRTDKELYIRENMLKVQIAAEKYASHHQGRYPEKVDTAFQSYFPFGGCDDVCVSALSVIFNPVTNMKELPVLGKVKDPESAKQNFAAKIARGVVEYSPIDGGKGYAIRGGGVDGKVLVDLRKHAGPRRVMVLTRDRFKCILSNMQAVQWAAESFAEDHGGKFPTRIDADFKRYFPGSSADHKKSGLPLKNPVTLKDEWPILGKVEDPRDARFEKPSELPPGCVEYSPIGAGRDYAIRGGNGKGKMIARFHATNQTLVLSKEGQQ